MKPESQLKKYQLIVWIISILFVVLAINNISWGTPGTWHPDELIIRVVKALRGEWAFDEINFDYPSLPKYVMFGLGKIILRAGYSYTKVILGARFISVLLGGALVLLSYRLTLRIGGNQNSALLAALISFTSSELLLNASFAHNDIYLAFFVTLTTLALLRYAETSERLWLYLSCLLIGLAASSKYNGLSLVFVPVFLFLKTNFGSLFKNWLKNLEITLIAGISLAAGYAIGTPKSILWLVYYAKRALPAITKHASYGWQPGARNGFFIQWQAMISALGWPLFFLFLAAVVYFLYKIIRNQTTNIQPAPPSSQFQNPVVIVLLVLLAYDLPILFSYNVQPRFFTSMVPLIASISALFILQLNDYLSEHAAWGKIIVMLSYGALLVFGGLRSAGVLLSFTNDQRIPATEALLSLPENSKIEYTLFPPNVNRAQFSSAHNYPIHFLKFPGQTVPTSPYFEFNTGEAGINYRSPDYLVIDTLTYSRFSDEYICELHAAECAFFAKLLADQTNYQLIQVFEYNLPAYIPEVNIAFLNPDIRIYQRINPE